MLDRVTPPPVFPIGNLSLPKPQSRVLHNGIEMKWLDGGSQEVNQLTISWRGGELESPVPCLPHLMASLMCEGTSTMSGAEISEFMDFHGAVLRVSITGHTTSLTLVSLNSQTLSVIPVLREIICSPTFSQQAFDALKDVEVKNLMLSLSRVSTQSFNAMQAMAYGKGHPQARVQSPEAVQDITLQQVRDFYDNVVTTSGCKVYLSGRLTPEIFDGVTAMLMSLPSRGDGMQLITMPLQPEAPGRLEIVKPDAVQASISAALPGPKRTDPDYIPLRLSVIGLGGYFGSRLMKNIREDKGYTYGISSYLMGSCEGSFIAIMAQTDAKYVDKVIDEVGNELLQLAVAPMPDDELTRLRQYVSSSLMEVLDSPFSILDYYRTIDSFGFPAGYFDSQVQWVHRLDSDTIMQMASKYMQPDQMRIAVCTNKL